jgi:hypothetical protein
MADTKKFLDADGVKVLYDLLSLQDYPNNDILMAVINAIDETKADKDSVENIQTQFNTLNEFIKPVSAAGVFADASALSTTIGELVSNNNKIEHNELTYIKVSDVAPTLEELKQGFNIVVSIKSDQQAAALDFNRLYYGLEILPETFAGESFNTNAALLTDNIIGLYLNQILVVNNLGDWDGSTFERGVYFAQNASTGFTVHSLKVNNFSFNATVTLQHELDKKLDKTSLFIGTGEEYNKAFANGQICEGTIVFITDDN